MKRAALLLLAASIVLPVYAQESRGAPKIVGTLKDVQGFVIVFVSTQSINAYSGAALVVDTRVVTTSTGSVTLAFDNGCDVKLTPNQSMVVKDVRDCAALIAVPVAAVPVAAVPVAAAPVAGGIGAATALGGAVAMGGAAALSVILGNQTKDQTSGN
jgi:hypothetical protein